MVAYLFLEFPADLDFQTAVWYASSTGHLRNIVPAEIPVFPTCTGQAML